MSIQAALIDSLISNSFLTIWRELDLDLNKSNAPFPFPKFEYLSVRIDYQQLKMNKFFSRKSS